MYIAKEERGGQLYYSIRETYSEDGELKSRLLFDLGTNPGRYIHYPGGNSYYIDESVELGLMEKGVDADTFDIEELFFPFMDARIKRVIRPSPRPCSRFRKSREETLRLQATTHIFDRRRLHYLRYGSIDQQSIEQTPCRFFLNLVGKSRDEIECMIDEEERKLKKRELKKYVYVIFDLQKHFRGDFFALRSPQKLDSEKMDRAFMDEFCLLNNDPAFCRPDGKVSPYLKKYLSYYIDHDFPREGFDRAKFNYDHSKGFMEKDKRQTSVEEACRILGVEPGELKGISKKELRRRYRRLAQKLHPDKGGEHERFIKLCNAYKRLVALKGGEGGRHTRC